MRSVKDANGHVVYGLKNGKKVARREPVLHKNGTSVQVTASKWYVEYRDSNDTVKRVAGYTDKKATQQFAAELERQSERERVGIVDVPLGQISAPFQQHLTDWVADLQRTGRSTDYIRKVRSRIGRLRDNLHWVTLSSIHPDGVTRWLALQLRRGLGQRTENHYVEALNSFCNWSVIQRRMEKTRLLLYPRRG